MSWQAIDFQGIVSLDTPLIDLYVRYLDEKEDELARHIIAAIPYSSLEFQTVAPRQASGTFLKLSDAIDLFSKHNYNNRPENMPILDLKDLNQRIQTIDKVLWEYIDIIENNITELFQQLEQLTLEQWHTRLAYVVGALRETLNSKIESLIWGIKRLEDILWRCRLACEYPNSMRTLFLKILSFRKTLLDKTLITHLQQSQEFLQQQYQKFIKRYEGYLSLIEQVDKEFEKFAKYVVFTSLDNEIQKHFLKLYQLLKLWEFNRVEKVLPVREFIIAMRNEANIEKATHVFREYYKAIKDTLFKKSWAIKYHAQEKDEGSTFFESIKEELQLCQNETHMLGASITNYREFLLKADPDPYVRTRLGFSEWTAGPEPAQLKPVLNMGYDVEALSDHFTHLLTAVKKGKAPLIKISEADPLIEKELHEMHQPLATHRMLRSYSEGILSRLEELDELGSEEADVVPYVGEVLGKLMRADWKYNVLHSMPLFHSLYSIHMGFLRPVEDWQHIARLHKFQKLLNQIQEWVKTQKTHSHFHEIEIDISDIKAYLQDFLGHVQRASNIPNISKEEALSLYADISQELLEYRYLFGNFFNQLRQNESEGQLIRKQFLCVDQYFESVEYRLYELKTIATTPTPSNSEE